MVEQEVGIKYFIIAFSVIIFVILHVWQNVEVMKIKMNYKKELAEERQLIDKNDRLRYEIERYKRVYLIERYAGLSGMKELSHKDFITINIE